MTFAVKIRGGTGLVLSEYLCPDHGRFELLVERDANGDPPAEMPCPVPPVLDDEWFAVMGRRTGMSRAELAEACRDLHCDEPSPWTISAPAVHTQFVVSATQGKSGPKPHPHAMDTRPLAEGRKNEWRQQRKKLREERRHQRVKEYLK